MVSVKDMQHAVQHSKDIENSIGTAGFKIKSSSFSGDSTAHNFFLNETDTVTINLKRFLVFNGTRHVMYFSLKLELTSVLKNVIYEPVQI